MSSVWLLALLACATCAGSTLPSVRAGTDSQRWYLNRELQGILDRETRSQVESGNAVDLLINGKAAFARRYENLESATFVLVKTFIWTDDAAGRELADALCAKARGGVPVIVQYDVKGNVGSAADATDMLSRASTSLPVGEPRVIADMRAAGVEIIATNSPGRPFELKEWVENSQRFFRDPKAAMRRSFESLVLFDHVDHDKYFVTGHASGELRAIIGGLNIASEYALGGVPDIKDPTTDRGGWRDTDIEIRGPSAHAVLDEFIADWERHLGKAPAQEQVRTLRELAGDRHRPAGQVDLRFVVNNPLFEEKGHMDRVYRILILATPKTEAIFLSTPYFAPSKELRDAMKKHMRGGGSVTVLTNSYQSSDMTILTDAARYSSRELMESEHFHLYERMPRPDLGEQMLHQKVASFGRYGPMVIGSANLDAQSFVHNGEAVAVIQDAELRAAFDAMVKTDIAPDRAKKISKEELNRPSVTESLRQFSAGELAWYWL